MPRISATRYHDFSCGHRVVGHEGKCALLHGHNYRAHFTCEAEALDTVGRVLDFSVINTKLCQWVEEYWDHRFLGSDTDTLLWRVKDAMRGYAETRSNVAPEAAYEMLMQSIVWVPFNPTAENMAAHLLNVIAPRRLEGLGVTCTSVLIEETRKCSVEVSL